MASSFPVYPGWWHPDADRDWGDLIDQPAFFGYYGELNWSATGGYWSNGGLWVPFVDNTQPAGHPQQLRGGAQPRPDAGQQRSRSSAAAAPQAAAPAQEHGDSSIPIVVHSSSSGSSSSSNASKDSFDSDSEVDQPMPDAGQQQRDGDQPMPDAGQQQHDGNQAQPTSQQQQPPPPPAVPLVIVMCIDAPQGGKRGKVVHYTKKGCFEARCPFHGFRCRRTRTDRAPTGPARRTRPGAGRPVGELIAWVRDGAWVPAADHLDHIPSKHDRRRARDDAKLSEHGRALLAKERQQKEPDSEDSVAGEPDSEPDGPF